MRRISGRNILLLICCPCLKGNTNNLAFPKIILVCATFISRTCMLHLFWRNYPGCNYARAVISVIVWVGSAYQDTQCRSRKTPQRRRNNYLNYGNIILRHSIYSHIHNYDKKYGFNAGSFWAMRSANIILSG